MDRFVTFSGPLAREAALRAIEEFHNSCHNPSNGKFCGGSGGAFSPGVKTYLKDQYQMAPETAKRLGLAQDGTKLMIPFRDEHGKVTSFKWRDTAVTEGPGRWGPPGKSHGMSVYENENKAGPPFVVESPSEGLILAAHEQRVIFFRWRRQPRLTYWGHRSKLALSAEQGREGSTQHPHPRQRCSRGSLCKGCGTARLAEDQPALPEQGPPPVPGECGRQLGQASLEKRQKGRSRVQRVRKPVWN